MNKSVICQILTIVLMPLLLGLYESKSPEIEIQEDYYYDYMQYTVIGGPAMDLRILPTEDKKILQVFVDEYRRIDDPVQLQLEQTASNEHIFELYYQALRNELPFDRKDEKSNLKTGSWDYLYLVKDGKQVEMKDELIKMTLSLIPYITIEIIDKRLKKSK